MIGEQSQDSDANRMRERRADLGDCGIERIISCVGFYAFMHHIAYITLAHLLVKAHMIRGMRQQRVMADNREEVEKHALTGGFLDAPCASDSEWGRKTLLLQSPVCPNTGRQGAKERLSR